MQLGTLGVSSVSSCAHVPFSIDLSTETCCLYQRLINESSEFRLFQEDRGSLLLVPELNVKEECLLIVQICQWLEAFCDTLSPLEREC